MTTKFVTYVRFLRLLNELDTNKLDRPKKVNFFIEAFGIHNSESPIKDLLWGLENYKSSYGSNEIDIRQKIVFEGHKLIDINNLLFISTINDIYEKLILMFHI
jgi:hypothetical protein